MVVGRFTGDSVVVILGSARLLAVSTTVSTVGVATAMLIPAVTATFVGLCVTGLGVSVMYPQLYDSAARSPSAESALAGLTAGGRLAMVGAAGVVGVLAQVDGLTVGAAIALVTIPSMLVLAAFSIRQATT